MRSLLGFADGRKAQRVGRENRHPPAPDSIAKGREMSNEHGRDKKQLSVWLDEGLMADLGRWAADSGESKSDVVRDALDEYFCNREARDAALANIERRVEQIAAKLGV